MCRKFSPHQSRLNQLALQLCDPASGRALSWSIRALFRRIEHPVNQTPSRAGWEEIHVFILEGLVVVMANEGN